MKKILTVILLTFVPLWGLVALELKVEGTFLVGSYPNDICWLTDDVIAMGSSNGFHVFNVKTKKHDILFQDNHTYLLFSNDRDGFCVVSTGNDIWLYFSTGRVLPMRDAVLRYQVGKLPVKYFKDYFLHGSRWKNISIDADAATITIRLKAFDESEVLHVIPIEGFKGDIITERYIPDTNKKVENDPVPWSYQKGINTLHDFFDSKSGNIFGGEEYLYSLVDYDEFSNTVVFLDEIYPYRVVIRNGLGYVNQIRFYNRDNLNKPSFDWILSDSPSGLVSVTAKTYITRDWSLEGISLGEEYYYPICLKHDNGTVIQYLDAYLIDSSFPVWVNWNRTRIAAICLNTDIKESCIAIFSVIRDGVVNDSSVRMRSGSSLDGKVLQVLTKGEAVKILDYSKDQETIEGITAYWCKISTSSGKEGWVFGAFVDCID